MPLKAGPAVLRCAVQVQHSRAAVQIWHDHGGSLQRGGGADPFCSGNFLNIWDDTFTEFTCNEAYIPDHDETLTIRLYNESAWDGPLGVWASEGEVSGMPLSVTDGDTLNATMAMQRVSDFTGNWPAALAARLQKPLAAAVFIAVLLAMLHAPLYLFVPAVGLALGVTFTYVTPALVCPR